MIGKNEVLKRLEETTQNGERIPCQIAFVTADRAAWEAKKRLQRELEATAPDNSDRIKDLTDQLVKIDLGCYVVSHDQCVLSGTRGMHAKKEKINAKKNPNLYLHRQRNIKFLPSGELRKMRIATIIQYNGQEVRY